MSINFVVCGWICKLFDHVYRYFYNMCYKNMDEYTEYVEAKKNEQKMKKKKMICLVSN